MTCYTEDLTFSPTKEIKSYSKIVNGNIEVFGDLADQIKTVGDCKTYNEDLINENVILMEQICKLFGQVKACEVDLQLCQNNLSQEINDIRDTKERLTECVNMVKERSLVKDQTHKKAKDKHNAYKQAIQHYKAFLDLYVHVEQEHENAFLIKLCFFTNKFDNTYSVTLATSDQCKWQLRSISPRILECQFIAIKQRLDETSNIQAFICTIRKIFLILRNK